jgi:hypothetical protein
VRREGCGLYPSFTNVVNKPGVSSDMDISALGRRLEEYVREGKLEANEVSRVMARIRQADNDLEDALNDSSQSRGEKVDDAVKEYNASFEDLRSLSQKLRNV